MSLFFNHSALRRPVALVLATILTVGCMTWRPVMGRDYVTAKRPDMIRVTKFGGKTVTLFSPTSVGNQLVGYRQEDVEASRVLIPMRQVSRIEVRTVDGRRTGRFLGTVAVVGGILGLMVWAASSIHYGFSLPIGRL